MRKLEADKARRELVFELYYPYKPAGGVTITEMKENSASYDRLVYRWKNGTFRLISIENIPNPALALEFAGVLGFDSEVEFDDN
jgi:hypothetical protein